LKKKGSYERKRPRPVQLGLEESIAVAGCSFNCHCARNSQQSRVKDGQGSASLEEESTRRDIVTWPARGSTIPLHKYMSYCESCKPLSGASFWGCGELLEESGVGSGLAPPLQSPRETSGCVQSVTAPRFSHRRSRLIIDHRDQRVFNGCQRWSTQQLNGRACRSTVTLWKCSLRSS
jgi:hypothetical protein